MCKLVSATLFFLAYWFYTPPASQKEENELTEETNYVNKAFSEESIKKTDEDTNKHLSSSSASNSSVFRSNSTGTATASEESITEL